MAQIVKNLPAMLETQIQSLGQEDSPEKGMAIHSTSLFSNDRTFYIHCKNFKRRNIEYRKQMPMYFLHTPHPDLSVLLSDGYRLRYVVFMCL